MIFINSDKDTENPSKKYSNRITPTTLPVIFANSDVAKAMIDTKRVLVNGVTEILKKENTGHNVLGYMNNNAKRTVVIGAHYDHLGFGEEKDPLSW